MVPATAGLASAVVAFGMLMSIFALPGQLQAGSTDVPLLLHTGPVLLQSSFGSDMNSINSDSLVIEAYVDANGRCAGLSHSVRFDRSDTRNASCCEEHADLHDVPTGYFDGETDNGTRCAFVFKGQRSRIEAARIEGSVIQTTAEATIADYCAVPASPGLVGVVTQRLVNHAGLPGLWPSHPRCADIPSASVKHRSF